MLLTLIVKKMLIQLNVTSSFQWSCWRTIINAALIKMSNERVLPVARRPPCSHFSIVYRNLQWGCFSALVARINMKWNDKGRSDRMIAWRLKKRWGKMWRHVVLHQQQQPVVALCHVCKIPARPGYQTRDDSSRSRHCWLIGTSSLVWWLFIKNSGSIIE